MILTITPNPTIDRVIFLRHFRMNAVLRAEREILTPSGKALDCSLVIRELDGRTAAAGLGAGRNGALLADLLAGYDFDCQFIPAQGETRIVLVIVDQAAGQQVTVTVPTLTASLAQLSGLQDWLAGRAPAAWGAIFAGSLPPGLPSDSYAQLIRQARGAGLVTLLDSSGEALRQGVGGRPDLLKINRDELLDLDATVAGLFEDVEPVSANPQGLAELAAYLGGRLGIWAGQAIIISLGAQGALAVTSERAYYAHPLDVPLVSTAGAGDALSAGLMLARQRGEDWTAALAWGTAAAGSVVMNEGTAICHRAEVERLQPQVQVRTIEKKKYGGYCEISGK